MWYLSLWVWLIWLDIISSCIRFVTKVNFYDWVLFHHVCLVMSWWASWLIHVLTIVNWATLNMGVQTTLSYADFITLRCIPCLPRIRTAGPYGKSSFAFLRNLRTIFHNGCTSLHFHHFSPHPCQRLLFFDYLLFCGWEPILTWVIWNLFVGFYLHFPDGWWPWAFSHVSVGHLYFIICKMSVPVLCLSLLCFC